MLRRREAHATVDERGASAVEYGLLVAAIAAIIVVVVFALGMVSAGSVTPIVAASSRDRCNDGTRPVPP